MSTFDSDVGIEKVLRPQWRFEELYCPNLLVDQVSGAVPILFTYPPNPVVPPYGTPDLSILDAEAAKNPPPPGISPNLAKFMPCSVGSTILCMFPIVPSFADSSLYAQKWAYVWRVVFRLRNAGDYTRRKTAQSAFAIGKANVGASDTRTYALPDRPALGFAGNRLVIPALTESQIFAGNPSVDKNITSDLVVSVDTVNQERAPTFGYIFSDAVAIPCDNLITSFTALYPSQPANLAIGRIPMDYQQGVFDPGMPAFSGLTNTGFVPSGPTHLPKFIKCLGNEMAVECFKYEMLDSGDVNYHAPKAWHFHFNAGHQCDGGADYGFSCMFGLGAISQGLPAPMDTGVRILQGSWPL